MTHRRVTAVTTVTAIALAVVALAACDDGAGSSPPAPASPVVPTRRTTADGGGMRAGAPSFRTFEVSSPVACRSGNAEATMRYTTLNVVDIEIKIGAGDFEGTAGYGPNETSVVASIPCSGAGTSTIQLRGCTEDGQCAASPARDVTISG